MGTRTWTIAVTALNATDNPGPGVGVIRSLRDAPEFAGRIIGLGYDSLDPGIYAHDLADDVFLLPYPSEGNEALEQRLRYIHDAVGLDLLMPTLDSELPLVIALQPVLDELGIGTLLPTEEQLSLRAKSNLAELGSRSGIPVPATRIVNSVPELYTIHDEIPYPFFVKGVFYGAKLARSLDEAVHAFHKTVAQWGVPVIVQAAMEGEEYDVVALGDGAGGMVGAVPMKKTTLTDKGKGWAGVTVRDDALALLTARFFQATRWRGPCEVELTRDQDGEYHLLEVNPRFPAWVYLSAGAGMNLPFAAAQLAAGESVEPLHEYQVGKMFVRISLDQIADVDELQQVVSTGELHRHALGTPSDTAAKGP